MYGKGPEGSPGAARCPRGVLRGRERSRVLSNAATDVLHEGPKAGSGDDRARRLAAGEGLPGGRHGLGEDKPCRFGALLVSEILGEPPYSSPGTFLPSYASAACGAHRRTLPGRRHASVRVSI